MVLQQESYDDDSNDDMVELIVKLCICRLLRESDVLLGKLVEGWMLPSAICDCLSWGVRRRSRANISKFRVHRETRRGV